MARPVLEISKLTPAERLQLVEELWESLCDAPETVPLTDAQRAELAMTWSARGLREFRGTR